MSSRLRARGKPSCSSRLPDCWRAELCFVPRWVIAWTADSACTAGRAPDDLVEDAMAGYLQELAQVREMLDTRYDDLKTGRVKPVDVEDAFALLRRKSEERRSSRS